MLIEFNGRKNELYNILSECDRKSEFVSDGTNVTLFKYKFKKIRRKGENGVRIKKCDESKI